MVEEKRYNLVMPKAMWDELSVIADDEHSTVLTVIIRCIRIGLWVISAQRAGTRFIVRENDTDKEVILLL